MGRVAFVVAAGSPAPAQSLLPGSQPTTTASTAAAAAAAASTAGTAAATATATGAAGAGSPTPPTTALADIPLLTIADLLHDKLKLLGYEQFCKEQHVTPPPFVYFAFGTVPFHAPPFAFYAKLAAWLADKAGISHTIGAYDPPATVAAAIRQAVKETDVDVSQIDPLRLRQPFGLATCEALNALADAALTRQEFVFDIPARHVAAIEQPPLVDAVIDDLDEELESVPVDISSDDDNTGIPFGADNGGGVLRGFRTTDDMAATAVWTGAKSPSFARPATRGYGSSSQFGTVGELPPLHVGSSFSDASSVRGRQSVSTRVNPSGVNDFIPALQGEQAAAWRVECDRVAARLVRTSLAVSQQIVSGADLGDPSSDAPLWRIRTERLVSGCQAVGSGVRILQPPLSKLYREVSETAETVRRREAGIAGQFPDEVYFF